MVHLCTLANSYVAAKVNEFIDWMEMTGSIWPTCGSRSHARLHTHTLSYCQTHTVEQTLSSGLSTTEVPSSTLGWWLTQSTSFSPSQGERRSKQQQESNNEWLISTDCGGSERWTRGGLSRHFCAGSRGKTTAWTNKHKTHAGCRLIKRHWCVRIGLRKIN